MFREAFIYNINRVLALGTGVVFTEIPLKMLSFDFEFKRTIHQATSNLIYCKILDNSTGKFLFKSFDDLRSISGTSLSSMTAQGFLPFNWPIPYTGKANKDISIYLSDFSGAENTIDLAYHGDAIRNETLLDMHGVPLADGYWSRDFKEKKCVPIVYESTSMVASAGVGNIKQGYVNVSDDADFVCTKITGIVTNPGYVIIEDPSRGNFWQNQKTHTGNLFGNGQFSNVLTSPRFIKKNTRLLITFENNHANQNTLQLYLHGYKRS